MENISTTANFERRTLKFNEITSYYGSGAKESVVEDAPGMVFSRYRAGEITRFNEGVKRIRNVF